MSSKRPKCIYATDTLGGKVSNLTQTFCARHGWALSFVFGTWRASMQLLSQTDSSCWMDNADQATCAPKSCLRLALSMIPLVGWGKGLANKTLLKAICTGRMTINLAVMY